MSAQNQRDIHTLASSERITVDTLINHILDRFFFTKKTGGVTISASFMTWMMERLTDKELRDLGTWLQRENQKIASDTIFLP